MRLSKFIKLLNIQSISLFSGLLITLLLILYTTNDSINSEKQKFIDDTRSIHDAILQKINSSDEVINSLSALFNTITYVDADQFRLFAEDALNRHAYLQLVTYMPLITSKYRKEFEAEMRENGLITFSIREQNNKRLTKSNVRSIYLPTLYLEPFTAHSARLLGFDVLSDPQLENAILRTIDSSHSIATLPNKSALADGQYTLFKALYTGKSIPIRITERRQKVNGLIGLHINIKKILDGIPNLGQLDVSLDLVSGPVQEKLADRIVSSDSHNDSLLSRQFNESINIKLLGYKFNFYTKKYVNWQDLEFSSIFLSLVIGLIITTLLFVTARRTQDAASERLLRTSELRLRKWNSALSTLAKSKMIANEEMLPSIQEILETAAKNMNVSRASVWIYNNEHDQINCVDLYENEKDQHSSGLTLSAKDYPTYFSALEDGRVINADDARIHLETCDFKENYLEPLNIMSLLDAPIRLEGQVLGTLCLEQIETIRRWAPDEQNFAASMADMVSMAIQASKRRKTEHALREARDKALVAEQTMSTFLANMSHEIRTPLTAVIGFSESLLEDKLTESDRIDTTNTIVRSGKHLLSIINDILDISKIEANKLTAEKLAVSPFELIADVMVLVGHQAEDKGITFDVKYDFPLPSQITTDPVRLKQILINLCNNAIKFTHSGGVEVRVWYLEKEHKLQFEVSDTGIGLTTEQKDKLFMPFAQADNSTSRKYGGTGLGLYLTKQLVELLGGEIQVSSNYGEGSVFVVSLDTEKLDDSLFIGAVPERSKRQYEDISPEFSVSGHVLLAEDNKDNQKLISMLLKKMGVSVVIANNGKEAVDMALSGNFNLILMDMQMPLLDGIEATKALREKNLKIPIIALTANTQNEDREKCQEAGCDDFLNKPIDKKLFYNIVGNHLQKEIPNLTPFDPDCISSLDEDPEYENFVQQFRKSLPEKLAEILNSFERKDWASMKKQTHDLKGTGGNFGYNNITELCKNLELEISKESTADIKNILSELSAISQSINTISESSTKNGNDLSQEKNILIVDDSDINIEFTKLMLAREGFHVETCSNGKEAISATQSTNYQAILMDLQMPVMDGIEATKRIRSQQGKNQFTPIIALTASVDQDVIDDCFDAGMQAYLKKPIDRQKVIQTLSEYVTHNSVQMYEHSIDSDGQNGSLPFLEGINTRSGLDRMSGNIDAYKKVLVGFYQKYNASLDDIKQSLSQNGLENVQRLTHSLKGTSGNIGAEELYQVAAKIERLCKVGNLAEVKENLAVLIEKHTIVMQSLLALVNNENNSNHENIVHPASTDTSADIPFIFQSLTKINDALEIDIVVALDEYDRLLSQLNTNEIVFKLSPIQEALSNYNIDQAKICIEQLRNELSSSASIEN